MKTENFQFNILSTLQLLNCLGSYTGGQITILNQRIGSLFIKDKISTTNNKDNVDFINYTKRFHQTFLWDVL